MGEHPILMSKMLFFPLASSQVDHAPHILLGRPRQQQRTVTSAMCASRQFLLPLQNLSVRSPVEAIYPMVVENAVEYSQNGLFCC